MASFYAEASDYDEIAVEVTLSNPIRDYESIVVTDVNFGTGSLPSNHYFYGYNVKKAWYRPSGSSTYRFYGLLSNSDSAVYLKPNTRYKLYCYAKYGTKFWYVGTDSCTTPKKVQKPSTPSGLRLTSRSNNSLSFSWYSASYADYYTFAIRNTYNNSYDYKETYSTSTTMYSLKGGTLYEACVRGENDDGYSNFCTTQRYLTYPNSPTLSIYEKGKDYIKVKVSCTDNWNYVNVYCPKTYETKKVYTNDSNKIVTFSGLNSNTSYTFEGVSYVNYAGTDYKSDRVTTSATTAANPRPNNWYWSTPKTSTECRISASEWNSFTSKINEFRKYKGYANYSFSTVSSGISFKAVHYNQALGGLSSICTTGLSNVSSGQSMDKATLSNNLNIMVNRMNSIT